MSDQNFSIGSDLIEIARVKNAVKKYRERFLNTVYHATELDYCMSKANPYPSLAARFAAKEAVSKAIGTGIGAHFGWKFSWLEIDNAGKPNVNFSQQGKALLAKLNFDSVIVSISHTKYLAQATALAFKKM